MLRNPFEVTKAVDFSDDEIIAHYVPFPGLDLRQIADPTSPMPQILRSGKGGGRTHLLRFNSYAVQEQRATFEERTILRQLADEGFVGIFFRCSGLNGHRFSGKGVEPDTWRATFNHYLDLWLVEHLVAILAEIQARDSPWALGDTEPLLSYMCNAIEAVPSDVPGTAQEALDFMRRSVREVRFSLDLAINTAAISRNLNGITLRGAPGDLPFDAAALAERHLPGLTGIRFTFIIDELENLTESQQEYLNTLIREKRLPTCFLVGTRRDGWRTTRTLSAGEHNLRGSEYFLQELEDLYDKAQHFDDFCRILAASRLSKSGMPGLTEDGVAGLFAERRSGDDPHAVLELQQVLRSVKPSEREHLVRLRDQIVRATADPGLATEIANAVSVPENPLLEKLAIVNLYHLWAARATVSVESAHEAHADAMDCLTTGSTSPANMKLQRWREDLIAQVYVSSGKHVPYYALDTYVYMASFIPRNFLELLKEIFEFADFNHQMPADGGTISIESQSAGVRRASEWYLSDAMPNGKIGADCDRAVRRLGRLLEAARFSDKPSAIACVAFATDLHGVTPRAIETFNNCVAHRLLLETMSGRSERASGTRFRKVRLHPMACPTFSLPIRQRGELGLTAAEINAIFDPDTPQFVFNRVLDARLMGMTAPFRVGSAADAGDETLF